MEQIFDHVKMHHRKDTNCISLTSNANVALLYGRGNYKDKYVNTKVGSFWSNNKNIIIKKLFVNLKDDASYDVARQIVLKYLNMSSVEEYYEEQSKNQGLIDKLNEVKDMIDGLGNSLNEHTYDKKKK